MTVVLPTTFGLIRWLATIGGERGVLEHWQMERDKTRRIESVFEDSIIGFRLADSLLLIETKGETPKQGEYVEILVNSLSLFNIDV